jgi:transcriptional regulator with XRE-family HTH domain
MIIGERLRELRQQKKFSQSDIQYRSALQRAYLSRVENGHTVSQRGPAFFESRPKTKTRRREFRRAPA